MAPAYGEFPKHGVTVATGALTGWNAVEERYHSLRGLAPGRRLGCQAAVVGDVVIDVPPESQVHKQVVRKRAEARQVVMDPATRLYYVEVAEPDMHEPSGDLERLERALSDQWGLTHVKGDLRTLQMLQPALRKGDWTVTCAVYHGAGLGEAQILHVWPGFYEGTIYGLAIDLGSTTIAGHLCDLVTGEIRASAGLMNPQIRFGEDLMSRVSYAMMNPGGAAEMTAAVRVAMNELVVATAAEAGVARELIFEAVIVCNPVMHHLLLGIDPVELGQAPFALATASALTLWATEIDMAMHPDARIYILPCIAGHVGADAAAVALSEGPNQSDELMLIVDVGTNAEILLGDRRKVLACSSPTGPAFEGAQISSGQRAAPGAIERVEIDPVTKEPRFRVIGSELWSDDPGFAEATATTGVTGICGSGIIEVIAEMRMAGLVDASGLIGSAEQTGTARCVPEGRTHAYVLHDASAAGGPRILVTQGDVRAIQLAKSALYAGARLLMDQLGVDSVDRVVLAGAFGAHISPQARDGARHDPRLRPRARHLGRQRRRHRRADRAAELRRPARGRDPGHADPQGRDRDRAALPGAFRRRERHPARHRRVPAPRGPRAAAGRAFQRRRRPRRRPPPPARLDRGRRDPRCAADDEAPDHGPLTPARFARRPAAGEDWRRDAHGRCHDGP